MKGYVFRFKNEEIKVLIKQDGTAKIIISHFKSSFESFVFSTDPTNSETNSLSGFIKLDEGESLEIELMEVKANSHPINVEKNVSRSDAKSKFDMFHEIEYNLEKRGLL